jgi:hypothetical protein
VTKPEEIQAIAAKHGVNPQDLQSIAPYYGATTEPQSLGEAVSTGAKAAAGTVGRALFNAPQKIYQLTQSPEMQKALDELQELGRQKQSYLQSGAEMVANPVMGVGPTSTAL